MLQKIKMFREKIREGKILDSGIDGDRVRLGLKNCSVSLSSAFNSAVYLW